MRKLLTITLASLSAIVAVFGSPQATKAYDYQGLEAQLISIINNERELVGAPPLTINWEVARVARYKAEEMKSHKLFDHESLAYGNPAELLQHFILPSSDVGANIAMGYETPSLVMEAWLSSCGHKANIVNPSFSSVGVGLSWDDEGIPYWNLIFIAD